MYRILNSIKLCICVQELRVYIGIYTFFYLIIISIIYVAVILEKEKQNKIIDKLINTCICFKKVWSLSIKIGLYVKKLNSNTTCKSNK